MNAVALVWAILAVLAVYTADRYVTWWREAEVDAHEKFMAELADLAELSEGDERGERGEGGEGK